MAGATTLEGLSATRSCCRAAARCGCLTLPALATANEEPRGFARLNGDPPVVSFAVFRAKDASDVTVAEAVTARLEALAAANPDVRFSLIDDSVHYTQGSYLSAMHALIEGMVLAALVVFLFLRDWRATVITAVAMPVSLIPTFLRDGAVRLLPRTSSPCWP